MYKEYIAYLKDNPKGYWFRRKLYGWGWTPATWQGWTTLALYLLVIFYFFKKIDTSAHSASDTLIGFTAPLILSTIALLVVCLMKGEKPKWQWGIPKEKRSTKI